MIIRLCTCGKLLGFKWGGWRMFFKRSHGMCPKCVSEALKEIDNV